MNNWINISSIVTYTLVTIVFTYSIISMFLYWKNFRVFVLENKIIIQKGRFNIITCHLDNDYSHKLFMISFSFIEYNI